MERILVVLQAPNFVKLIHLKLLYYKLTNQIMSVDFSTDDYAPPQWSAMPRYSYHLQIIKDGSIIGNINIKQKQFILVGRSPDICDLFIDNPSISRKHAIIQFKKDVGFGYLYDLGSRHGTQVNKRKLPARAYQQLKPFDMIKFGVSSRCYVFRCSELEHQELQQQNEADNKFQQVLAERKKQLSKHQLKQKYLELLENDPIYKANNLRKKLNGEAANQKFIGVDWGISDEHEVYSYRNESQFQLEPDVIRRLPGLDQIQLDKITQYQSNLRKYEEVQSELNQLANKQRRQFGLEEKLRQKKEKLEKRFVEAIQVLERSEDWIRVNLFGSQEGRVAKKQRAQKEDDTFEDDQFFDRTLKDKKAHKQQNIQLKPADNNQTDMFTTQDFWKLEKQLRSALKNLIELENQQNIKNINEGSSQNCYYNQDKDNHENIGENSNQCQQDDDLDAYMKQNNQRLEKQQHVLNNERIALLQQKVSYIKKQLVPFIGFAEVQKIQSQERKIKTSDNESEDERKMKKQIENKKKISDVLYQLDVIKEMDQQIDEQDVKIFEMYKGKKVQDSDQQQQFANSKRKRNRPEDINQEAHHYDQRKKLYPSAQSQSRDNDLQKQQQEFYDLTKFK